MSPLLTAREMFPVAVAASTFTSPDSRPIIAGLPPGNGMCFTGVFTSTLKKYSAAICEPLPMPAEPMNTLPALASVTRSARVFTGAFRTDGQRFRRRDRQRHRVELGRGIAAIRDQRFIDRQRRGGDQDGVAVRRRAHDPPRRPDAAAAFQVLDHDGLSQALAQPRCDPAADRVGKATGGKADDEIDPLIWDRRRFPHGGGSAPRPANRRPGPAGSTALRCSS